MRVGKFGHIQLGANIVLILCMHKHVHIDIVVYYTCTLAQCSRPACIGFQYKYFEVEELPVQQLCEHFDL